MAPGSTQLSDNGVQRRPFRVPSKIYGRDVGHCWLVLPSRGLASARMDAAVKRARHTLGSSSFDISHGYLTVSHYTGQWSSACDHDERRVAPMRESCSY